MLEKEVKTYKVASLAPFSNIIPDVDENVEEGVHEKNGVRLDAS